MVSFHIGCSERGVFVGTYHYKAGQRVWTAFNDVTDEAVDAVGTHLVRSGRKPILSIGGQRFIIKCEPIPDEGGSE